MLTQHLYISAFTNFVKVKMTGKNIILLIAFLVVLPNYAYAESSLPVGVIKIIEYQNELSQSITFLIAFLAGVISFTSPCGFALFPTYFAFAFKDKKKSMLMTVAFSVGMLIAFIIFGVIAGILGDFLNEYKLLFATISGYLLVLFGLMLFLNIGFSIFNFRIHNYSKKGMFGIAIVGFLFGTAWTPCVGPILVGILVLAANSGIVIGTLSLLFYGLGVVVPLLIISYLADKYNFSGKKFFFQRVLSFKIFNRNFEIHSYNLLGGLLLIVIGILIILYKGTFFFQTTMIEYLPWSMYVWGYMNEILLSSKFLTSKFIGNLIGVIIFGIIIWIVLRQVGKNKKGNEK